MDMNITTPGAVIGFKKNGDPIRLIAGGSENAPEGGVTQTVDPGQAPPQQQPNTQYFTAEDIARAQEKARQEEKDKLYGRISKQDERFKSLEDELATLRQEREAREAEEKRRQEEQAQLAKSEAEKELSAKELFEKRQQEMQEEWQEKFNKLEQEREAERVANQKEREYLELRDYAQRRVAEEADNIAPELVDFVTGNTKEEIEASINTVKAKTDAIVENMNAAQTQFRAQQRGTAPTGFAATGPMDNNSIQQTLSAEDIAAMSVSEWAKYREKLGIGNSQNNRGILG